MRTKITAHSGSEGTPDNSLEFVRYALSLPCDALEADIHMDPGSGVLALGHDGLDEDSPRLSEVFSLLAEHPVMQINCDLKERGLEEPVYQLAEKYAVTDRLQYSGSVDWKLVAGSRLMAHDVTVLLNAEEVIPGFYEMAKRDLREAEACFPELIAVCTEWKIPVLNIHYRTAGKKTRELLREAGVGLSVWTVNREEDMEPFLREEIWSRTTRRPAAALRLRGSIQ